MNNRPIKFRIWDTFTKKMVDTGYHVIGETTCFQLVEQWAKEHPNGDQDFLLRLNDFVEMQYTGLKDKEGKEIYEGDIIKFETEEIGTTQEGIHNDIYYQKFYIGVIEYSAPKFVFKVSNGKLTLGIDSLPFYKEKDYEILGNIFENPSLLTDNN